MPDSLNQLVRTAHAAQGVAQTRAAARLMSVLEDEPYRLPELLQCPGLAVKPSALILGITGAPGSGKSTLVDALIAGYRKQFPQRRIGVIAVDPSSPFTGGAVLGDRVRMMRHATDPLVFVRSMATRGHLGGLTLGVRGVIRVMELIGCDLVLIETVGVGQSEVEIAGVADRTLIVLAPGQGDSIQLLKAGLMEIGDVFAVNKADKPGAAELYSGLLAVLKLGTVTEHGMGHHANTEFRMSNVEVRSSTAGAGAEHPGTGEGPELGMMRSGALPEVFLVSAVEGTGMAELLNYLEKQAQSHGPAWAARRDTALREEVRQAILEEARRQVEAALGANGTVGRQVERVLGGEVSVAELAKELLKRAGDRKG